LLPRPQAEVAARVSLRRVAKQDIYRSWLKAREAPLFGDAICVRDELPTGGPVDLGPFVPFLAD
jgi:hypothetical protein